jgi:hypothetical protein
MRFLAHRCSDDCDLHLLCWLSASGGADVAEVRCEHLGGTVQALHRHRHERGGVQLKDLLVMMEMHRTSYSI